MVICLKLDADLHAAQLMPLPLTVSCFSKNQIGYTFLVQAHPCSPGQKAIKRVCVCIFSDFRQTNYLNIHQTDLHEIYSIGRTMAIDERCEVIFSIPQGTLPRQPILWAKSTSIPHLVVRFAWHLLLLLLFF